MNKTRCSPFAAPDSVALVTSPVGCICLGRPCRDGCGASGLDDFPQLAPPEPIRRYEKSRPGERLRLDIKKLGRIQGIGHRITGNRQHANRGIGWDFVHVAIDDASRVAYAEILEDQRGSSATSFLKRAVGWFAKRGVKVERLLTDNGGLLSRRSLCRRLPTTS